MKSLAGIVLYNPDINRLKSNIFAVLNQVDELVLVDNGSDNLRCIEETFKDLGNIFFLKNKKNMGIAAALNQIMHHASINSYKWCLLLDQDSIVPINMIESYHSFLDGHLQSDNIGIIGPRFIDVNKKQKYEVSNQITQVLQVITSGSYNSVEVWEKIGGFDEYMFIDGVDFEYCYRLRKMGYSIFLIESIEMLHEIGKIKAKKILLWQIESFNHSSIRKYYIVRNILYFSLKHNHRITLKAIVQVLKQFYYVLMVDDLKIEKIKYMFKGIKDVFKTQN